MPSGEGYRPGLKVLHWTMAVALAAQFVVGLNLDDATLLATVVDRWFGGEEEGLVLVHAALGVTVLVLAVLRVVWRRLGGLPAWAPGLSPTERIVVHWVERVLYACMFLAPLTGLGLLLLSGEDWDLAGGTQFVAPMEVGDDDVWLAAHVTTQVAFVGAFVAHMGIVVRHGLRRDEHYLSRMT